MISPFNIFRVEKNGESKWLEPADSLTEAQARVAKLGAEHPGEYLIVAASSGHKEIIVVGSPDLKP